MKKILQWMFLLVLMSMIGTIQAQSFNYLCDFETDTTGWTFLNGTSTNYWVIDTAVNNTGGGSYSLYITNAEGHPHAYTNSMNTFVCAYRDVVLEAGTYDFMYDWMASGEGSSYKYDYLRVALVPSSETITPGVLPSSFNSLLPYGWLSLDNEQPMNNCSSWQTNTGEVNVASAGTYKLAFFWRNDYSGGTNPPAAIDNVMLKFQTCSTPSNFVVNAENITSTGATISWTENGTASMWQLEYGPYGFASGTGTLVTDIFESSYTFTDLNPNTAYEVRVQSVCDVSDISNPLIGFFRTACGDMVLPYTENFESYEDDAFPFCWFYKSGDVRVSDNSYDVYAGTKSLDIEEDGVLLTPKVMQPLNEVGVYFAARPDAVGSSGVLEIGYVTDTTIWDYVPVRTIQSKFRSYAHYEIDFDATELDE